MGPPTCLQRQIGESGTSSDRQALQPIERRVYFDVTSGKGGVCGCAAVCSPARRVTPSRREVPARLTQGSVMASKRALPLPAESASLRPFIILFAPLSRKRAKQQKGARRMGKECAAVVRELEKLPLK